MESKKFEQVERTLSDIEAGLSDFCEVVHEIEQGEEEVRAAAAQICELVGINDARDLEHSAFT